MLLQAVCDPFLVVVHPFVILYNLQVVAQFERNELHGLPHLPLFCRVGDFGRQPQRQQHAARNDRELADIVADIPLFKPFF